MSTAHILIIEDDDLVSRTVERSLSGSDFQISLADNGLEGIKAARNAMPDLVILDSSLSADELHATLRQIKELYPDVRCIIVAASPQQGRALKASSADAVLVEGAPAALFSTTIKDLLAKSSQGEKL